LKLRLHIFLKLLILGLCVGCSEDETSSDPFYELLRKEIASRKVADVTVDPELENHAAYISAFRESLKDPRAEGLKEQWAELGFEYAPFAGTLELECYQLSEVKEQKLGRGYFLFFPDSLSSNILQIPHQYIDTHTGKIAVRLAKENYFRVIAWNTLNRYAGRDHEKDWNTDFSNAKDSSFTALAHAFNEENEGAYLFQIHGFSKTKRITRAGRQADFILSSGHYARTSPAFELMVQSMKNKFANVYLFPTETGELGATKNVSGNILNKGKINHFIHIELSAESRENLIAKQKWRDSFYEALFSVSNL
jgi:hypothetical protein